MLSETGETARYVAKFHPESPIVAVTSDPRIGKQIEGYMCSAFSLVTTEKRGDGMHIKAAFDYGKQRGLFIDNDVVIAINTTRNEDGVKQFMVRILFVTSGDPHLATKMTGAASGVP